MRRVHLIELHDHARCPATLRDAATDFLRFLANTIGSFDAIGPRLAAALGRTSSRRVVDLASGGGGPWPALLPSANGGGNSLPVVLTDLLPNEVALGRIVAGARGRISFETRSVDATRVPPGLDGARTIFGALHHFRPAGVAAILRDAVSRNEMIAAFESQERRVRSVLSIALLPLASWLVAPFLRPFRWSRLAWTYPIPLAPFVIGFDGVVSCLRTYSPTELRSIVESIDAPGYRWEIGRQRMRGLPLHITYLIGIPPTGSGSDAVPTTEPGLRPTSAT